MHNFHKPLYSAFLLKWFPLFALCAVIAHYFFYIHNHAANIPYADDIWDLLRFVVHAEKLDGVQEKFETAFRQYNDHRVGATRLLVYGVYLIEGEMDFRTLTIIANLGLLLILFLFYLIVRDEEFRWVFLLISSLLLLNLKFYTLVFMAQAAFAYYFVFIYAFACLFTLHKVTPPKFVLAAVFCSLSSFTFAAGQAAWLLGLVSLIHQSLVIKQKPVLYPLLWLLVAAAMLSLWRMGFESLTPNLPTSIWPADSINPPLEELLVRSATFFLAFLGSAFINSSVFWAGASGLALLVALVFVTLRCYRDDDIRLVLCCWFAVATLAAATVGRVVYVVPDDILHARYNFFSVMLVCPLTLLVLMRFAVFRTYAVYLIVVLALMYSAIAWRNSDLSSRELNSLHRNFNNGFYPVAFKPQAKGIVIEAISLDIYKPPCRPFPRCETGE
jgi:hypothetical protein